MGGALVQHDEVLRAAVERHNGYVFKTVGDAFCVAFEGAMEAVRSAISAQRELATTAWPDTGPIRVRMAIHSGEVEQRDSDYFGPTLNRVARLLGAGHGGQTLLSRVTAEMVREHLPEDASLRDCGERRLKDLSRPERIFQLVVHDLPSDFPPLRSLEVLPNNLPAQVTNFIGRDREMAELKRLIRKNRLVTLIGSGGTGKTRLSLQTAAELLEEFPHGIWLVEFATVSIRCLCRIQSPTSWKCERSMVATRWTHWQMRSVPETCCWCWIIANTSSAPVRKPPPCYFAVVRR
jgi:hypothetical protein